MPLRSLGNAAVAGGKRRGLRCAGSAQDGREKGSARLRRCGVGTTASIIRVAYGNKTDAGGVEKQPSAPPAVARRRERQRPPGFIGGGDNAAASISTLPPSPPTYPPSLPRLLPDDPSTPRDHPQCRSAAAVRLGRPPHASRCAIDPHGRPRRGSRRRLCCRPPLWHWREGDGRKGGGEGSHDADCGAGAPRLGRVGHPRGP